MAGVNPTNAPMNAIEPVAVGGVLLHIGLHKTGTTSLQETLAAHRESLLAHQVRYPGTSLYHHRAIVAYLGGSMGWRGSGSYTPAKERWETLLEEANFPQGRTIISSEYLDDQSTEVAQRLVSEFADPDKVQIAITVRSMAKSLSSIWQQTLKSGSRSKYSRWLDVMFGDEPLRAHQTFWNRYRVADVVQRWADAVGPERVNVVVIPPNDHQHIFQSFSQLLALPYDFFEDRVAITANRSMCAEEAELIRNFNMRVSQRTEWRIYQQLVRHGAINRMVSTPNQTGQRIATPSWAIERATASDQESAVRLDAMGVKVIGDTRWLYEDPPVPGDQVPPTHIDMQAASLALEGLLDNAMNEVQRVQQSRPKRNRPPPPSPPPPKPSTITRYYRAAKRRFRSKRLSD